MLARLWWKEMRIFWPALLALFGSGVGLQVVLLASGADGVRSGVLMSIALGWAVLYAFVVASAAFAGERETGTLGLLDALPVGRRTLWFGKTSFALATTLGLALIMLGLGALGTTQPRMERRPGPEPSLAREATRAVLLLGPFLYEAAAWGLLWSSLLRNPMAAGGLAVCSVALVAGLELDSLFVASYEGRGIPARLAIATLALVASAVPIAWPYRSGWSPRLPGSGSPADRMEWTRAHRRLERRRNRRAQAMRILMMNVLPGGVSLWSLVVAFVWGILTLLLSAYVVTPGVPPILVGVVAAAMAGAGVLVGRATVGGPSAERVGLGGRGYQAGAWATGLIAAALLLSHRGTMAGVSTAFLGLVSLTLAVVSVFVGRATASRALTWKAVREGLPAWLGVSAVAWGALVFLIVNGTREAVLPQAILGLGAALVAGVNVFGGSTATGSQRFLLHLGVAPGPIWGRTMRAWGMGLVASALVLLGMSEVAFPGWWRQYYGGMTLAGPGDFPYIAAVADAFAVGTLAGMVFPRRLTAAMVAVIAWLAIAPIQLGLAEAGMVSQWALLLTPPALLVISRAWAGDWLDPRPGPGRWLRLAAYTAAPSIAFPMAFIAHRAWGLPDPGPVAVATPGAPSADAGLIATYNRLLAEIRASQPPLPPGRSEESWTPGRGEYLMTASPDQMALIRRAAEIPPPPSSQASRRKTVFDPSPALGETVPVAWLLDSEGRKALDRGDLPDAWADIIAQYRVARQLAALDPTATSIALGYDRRATALALDWAAHGGQTQEMLRRALVDLRDLAPLPSLADVLRVEGPVVDRTFDLPAEELQAADRGPRGRELATRVLEGLIIYPWWERERARRLCRNQYAALIAAPNPGEARRLAIRFSEETRRESRLARTFMTNWDLPELLDRTETLRRVAVQVIALRAWALAHDGNYPETLDALVPDFLDRLPADPYSGSGRPFGYARSDGRRIAGPDLLLPSRNVRSTAPGQRLLISVGPDGRPGDLHLHVESGRGVAFSTDDLIFPLP